jgi:hypothetical protein
MLRELQVTKDKPANSMYKCGEDKLTTGSAVVLDDVNKNFAFPTANRAGDLFFVDKERIPTGLNAVRTDVSDYDEDFTTVKANEFAKVIAYYVGERFATDQFVKAGLAVNDRVVANNQGQLIKGTNSRYVFKGLFNDAGHELAIIQVSDALA